MRSVHVEPPAEIGVHAGLAYALFLPAGKPLGGVMVLHGATSCKESHFDFARALRSHDIAAVAFDQRGHGATGGALDGRALDDIGAIASLLPPGPLGLRGSSMGGHLALIAAAPLGAVAVVAICPAPAEGLLRGLRDGRFEFDADVEALETLLIGHDATQAAAELGEGLLLLHAEGDEQVAVEHSRQLHAAAPASRLITVPGGHHRSVQHDHELQAHSVRFLAKAFRRHTVAS
jgi:uncharacterized protein